MDANCKGKGQSLCQALQDKYINSLLVESSPGISFSTLGGGKRELEYARSEKLNRQLRCQEKRTEIDLKNSDITEVDNVEGVTIQFQNVRIVDLSFNRISSWEELAKLSDLFPKLEHLIITGNPLNFLGISNLKQISSSFSKIKALTLGKLNCNWDEIYLLFKLLPHVEHLDLFNNNITSISQPEKPIFDNLKTLILSHNAIVKWSYIEQLSTLENLTSLQLVQCSIETISISSSDKKTFPRLKHLDLKNNKLQSWQTLAELNKLPVLEELIVRGNPLYEDINHDYAFNFTLSIIGGLRVLNRQEITPSLRKEGELHYLRYWFLKYLEAQEKNEANFFQENPRYLLLIEKYGPPVDLLRTKIVKKSLITLTIIDVSSGKQMEKKIPRRTTVSGLKVLVKRLMLIEDLKDIDILYSGKTVTGEVLEYILEKEDYPLDYYSLEDGDVLLIKSGK